jgi:hypothetical protein
MMNHPDVSAFPKVVIRSLEDFKQKQTASLQYEASLQNARDVFWFSELKFVPDFVFRKSSFPVELSSLIRSELDPAYVIKTSGWCIFNEQNEQFSDESVG